MKPELKVSKSKKQVTKELWDEKLAILDKKKKQDITLEDIYGQNTIIIDMLKEIKG